MSLIIHVIHKHEVRCTLSRYVICAVRCVRWFHVRKHNRVSADRTGSGTLRRRRASIHATEASRQPVHLEYILRSSYLGAGYRSCSSWYFRTQHGRPCIHRERYGYICFTETMHVLSYRRETAQRSVLLCPLRMTYNRRSQNSQRLHYVSSLACMF